MSCCITLNYMIFFYIVCKAYYVILYCIIWYCITSHFILMRFIMLNCITLCGIVLYSFALNDIRAIYVILYYTISYYMKLHACMHVCMHDYVWIPRSCNVMIYGISVTLLIAKCWWPIQDLFAQTWQAHWWAASSWPKQQSTSNAIRCWSSSSSSCLHAHNIAQPNPPPRATCCC